MHFADVELTGTRVMRYDYLVPRAKFNLQGSTSTTQPQMSSGQRVHPPKVKAPTTEP